MTMLLIYVILYLVLSGSLITGSFFVGGGLGALVMTIGIIITTIIECNKKGEA